MQKAKWLPSARITNSLDFDHLQGLHALLEFRILRSETSSWFLQATHHGHQDAIAEFCLDLHVPGILLCTLSSLRREGWH